MARWCQVSINDNGGSGSSPSSYWMNIRTASGAIEYLYGTFKSKSDSSSNRISVITTPTRTYFTYNGHWTAKSGGSKVIAASGDLSTSTVVPSGSSITVYAHWTRLSYTLTFDKDSGTGGTSTIYGKATSGGWYSNWKCTSAVTAITPPTRSGYVFSGYYSAANGGGTKYVNADGTFTGDFELLVLTANATVYAYWKVRHEITVAANGGTGGTTSFWYVPDDGAFYDDAACQHAVTAITPPTKSGALFLGLYDTDSTSGTQVVAEDGTISSSWTPSADATVYAQWRTVATITFDKGDGESGDDALVYDSSDDSFHVADDPTPTDEVTPPNWECHRFLGYFSASTGGTQYIDEDGQITNALRSLTISGDFTIYAQWQLVSYKATLDPGEGSADMLAFYCDGSAATFYADDLLAGEPITAVAVPVRAGYDFTGYWTASTGGTKYVDADGSIACGAFSADVQLYAQWQVRTYTATFDYNGGSGSPASKTVTWGVAIGTLPTPSASPGRDGAEFGGWQVDGEPVDATTVWRWDRDATVKAKWITAFQYVEDFFNLASAALVPVSSNSGDSKTRTCVMNAVSSGGAQTGAGRYSRDYSHAANDPTEVSGVWRNPSVTYDVVADCTVTLKLGKAFAAQYTGTGSNRRMTVSGYMIVDVRVETSLGTFPRVTVTAVANEGADAVNLFDVSIPVVARARAQLLLGALTGGGNLRRCDAAATCSPVVVAENNMPCASDVVGGRYVVSAETLTPNREAAPVAANGFTSTGEPKSNGDRDYPSWSVSVEKEIV